MDETDPTAELVKALESVAKAARALQKSRLKPDAVALLIQHSMPIRERVGVRDIRRILEAAAKLDVAHLKPLRKRN